MTHRLTRRAALGAAGGLLLAAPAVLRAAAAEPAGKAAALGFETARAERLSAPLQTLSGRLPPDLTGVLWRNGPGEHDRFGHRYSHWFDGDGLVQAFRFDGTGATHRARILDTPKRRREAEAGRRLLPAYGTLPPDPVAIERADDMNAANIAMLAHAGRLMALWEGGSAIAVDPETLAAGDFVTWRDDLASAPFSAHPKLEPDGTLWNIGAVIGPRSGLLVYRIDPEGRLAGARFLPHAPLGLTHDFVVTARHLVVLMAPFVLDFERLRSGETALLDAHLWRPELGVEALVIDKDSLEVVRRHELPPGFHFHHGNGWEEADGSIRFDVCQAPDPEFVTRDLRLAMRGETGFPSPHPAYRRIVLRADGRAALDHDEPGVAEFPRIDPRLTGRRHEMTFALAGDGKAGGWPFRRIVRLEPDAADGWEWPPGQLPEEHVFVPRGAGEGEGWLLGPFLDLDRRVAGLAVFDALRLSEGPLWQGLLPYPLPHALHGAFVPA